MDRRSAVELVPELFVKSLIILTFIQVTQTKVPESTSARSLSSYRMLRPSETLHDPMVLDPDSLYQTEAGSYRRKRSATQVTSVNQAPKFVDACQSKVEVVTPYHATNSKGKVRKIVNSELMQQAIQLETCLRQTQSTSGPQNRCNAQPECGCEQKYKWHRLLVLDPDEDQAASGGLFMDWFLFPSNCVCRCKPTYSTKNFLRTVSGTKRQHQSE